MPVTHRPADGPASSPYPALETSFTSAHIISRGGAGISGHSSCVCGIGAYSTLLEHLHVLWLRALTKPIVTVLLADVLKRCSAEMPHFTGAHSS